VLIDVRPDVSIVELRKEETTHSPVKNVTRFSNHKELSWVEGDG
jgi:hypothetical protein